MSVLLAINNTTYELPLAWSEVTLSQYCRLCVAKNDTANILAALLNISRETLLLIDENKLNSIILPNIQWLNYFPETKAGGKYPEKLLVGNAEYTVPATFDNLTFGQVILFEKTISENTEAVTSVIKPAAFAKLLAIALARNKNDKSITDRQISYLEKTFQECYLIDALQLLHYLLDLFAQTKKREQNLLSRPLKAEERQADIMRFEKFGPYPLIRLVMEAEGLTYNEVLQLPYHRAFVCIWYEKERNAYQEKLLKIYNNKTKN